MRYIIISFFLLFASFTLLSAAKDAEVYIGNSAPLAATTPDSIHVSAPNSKKGSFQIVEDTALPPCDIIFFRSGKIDYCKIVEVTPANITYKMCDYVDGPSIVVNKSTVKKVRYANGKEELFTEQQPQTPQNIYQPPAKDRTGKLALIFSLCGLLISILAIPGLILGIISLVKIERSKGALRGKGTAIWAICISALIIILVLSTL